MVGEARLFFFLIDCLQIWLLSQQPGPEIQHIRLNMFGEITSHLKKTRTPIFNPCQAFLGITVCNLKPREMLKDQVFVIYQFEKP